MTGDYLPQLALAAVAVLVLLWAGRRLLRLLIPLAVLLLLAYGAVSILPGALDLG